MASKIELLRNVGITAHIDAGKTQTTDLILKLTGEKREIGLVHEGKTTTDFMVQERERGITIQSAAVHFMWNGANVNIIDTPGHIDFGIEVRRALRVLDGLAIVFCSVGGVQPQTITNWLIADKYSVPRIAFINKMDRDGADFFKVVEQMRTELYAKPAVMQLPIGEGANFSGVVDLLTMQEYVWENANDSNCLVRPVREELKAQAAEYRSKLIEQIVEGDNVLMEKFFEDENSLTVEELKAQLRKDTISRRLIPVLCGSALKQKGGQPLLDAMVDYLPSPEDRSADPMQALAFKLTPTNFGTLTFARNYAGPIAAGTKLYNATKGKWERVGKIFKIAGDKYEPIPVLDTGDIGGFTGLDITLTGHTLCERDDMEPLESIDVPEPVVHQAVEPKSRGDQEKMDKALASLMAEDPSFVVQTNEETGQTIIAGQGELHLDIKVDILKRTYKVEVNRFPPEVSYREAITKNATGECKFKKQTGGKGQYGHAVVTIEPLPKREGFEFVDAVNHGVIPEEFVKAVKKGIIDTIKAGTLAGYPVVGVKVTLIDGSYHAVDSSDRAFQMAGSMAFKDAFAKASPILLEPIGKLTVVMPDEFVGGVIGEINQRRGIPDGQDTKNGQAIVQAAVPMSEMFGFTDAIRSKSQGKAHPTLEFNGYKECPKFITEQVVTKRNEPKS